VVSKLVASVVVCVVLGGCSSLQTKSSDDNSPGSTTRQEVVYNQSSALDEILADLALTIIVESALDAAFGSAPWLDNAQNSVSSPQHTTTTENPADIQATGNRLPSPK